MSDVGVEKRIALLAQALMESEKATPDSTVGQEIIEMFKADSSINDIATAKIAVRVQLDQHPGVRSRPSTQTRIKNLFDKFRGSKGRPTKERNLVPAMAIGLLLIAILTVVYAVNIFRGTTSNEETAKAPTPAVTTSIQEQVKQVWKDFLSPFLLADYSPEQDWWYDVRGVRVPVGGQRLTLSEYFRQIPNAQKFVNLASFIGNLDGWAENGDLETAKASANAVQGVLGLSQEKVSPVLFVSKVIPATKTQPGSEKEMPVPTFTGKPVAKSQPTSTPVTKPTQTPVPAEKPTATLVPTAIPNATPIPTPAPTIMVMTLPTPKAAVYYVYPHKGVTQTGTDIGLDRGQAFMTVLFWTRNLWGVEADVVTYSWINRQLDAFGSGGGNLAPIYDEIVSKLPTPVPLTAPYVLGSQGLTREQAFATAVDWWKELRKEEPDVAVNKWINRQLDEVGVGGDITAVYRKIAGMSSK